MLRDSKLEDRLCIVVVSILPTSSTILFKTEVIELPLVDDRPSFRWPNNNLSDRLSHIYSSA